MIITFRILISILLLILLLISCNNIDPSRLPYPQSPFIRSVTWDKTSLLQYAEGSDQWPMTWADDGNIYAGWGDGYGWELKQPKYNLGITKIQGYPPSLDGIDVFKYKEGHGLAKPEALIAIGKRIYFFYTNGLSKSSTDNTSIGFTDNYFKTVVINEEKFFDYAPDGFRVRGVLQQGKGYDNTFDQYVYIYCGFNKDSSLFLARIEKQFLLEADKWEWFSGTSIKPEWSYDFQRKKPAFIDKNLFLWHIGISYFKGLNRVILTKPHFKSSQKATDDRPTSFGIFESVNPWGPWHTVLYVDNLVDDKVKFSYFIPNKYVEKNDFWLMYSGWPEYDNVSFLKGSFILNQR